ncbi:ras-related protein Rab-44 [Petaurus breviceps papuanus]|uniref:ras-related protein Rab-44 n=1 Tax=Petaurus breviceps papuanus TaxID=3040969 RepID=UPI0036D8C35C
MESNPRAGRKSRKLGSRRRHQMREGFEEDAPPAADPELWPSHATEELQDFFGECGAEHKGFITREDLGKAKFSFLSSPEELQLIFDWMDPERKGSLTPKEFTSGLKNVFSSQTKIPGPRKRKTRTWIFSKEEPTSFQSLEEADPEERRWFLSFMEQLGTDHSFLDQAEIWQLWKKLRQEEPQLVGNLEGFLAKVTSRLQETQAEKEALQMTLKKCDDDHHHEVQQLYEEMEQQIHSEKQRLQAASDTQGLAYSSKMHQALEAKEREMQYLTEGQRELEAQIDLLRRESHEVSMENQRLQETQRDLTGQLEQVQGHLQVTRGHLRLARGQASWQVEEETSDPPLDPKNTSDSQHLVSFPEENPLPSLFEEGEWSQLLTNFTSPQPGNTTQVSWSPPPTPTSLQGHRTPRVVRQISITEPKFWQLNQESPSNPEVPPMSPLGPSAVPTVVSELKVAGEPKREETFQWDFQRVSSGEPAITSGGQEGPVLGDSLPSQGLARSSNGAGDTDGDEVGQGNGPISDIFSKGSSSEESLQTLGPSADMQANTWEVGPKETPHPGLHPAGSEQEVGSWGNEVFTAGLDVPIKTPELVFIQENTLTRKQEQEKMNTDGWKVETSQQKDSSDQEAGLRESTGPDVGEVPGDRSRSKDSPGPDVGEVPGEESRRPESLGPDVGEVPGEGSRSTESLEPDVGEVPGEGSRRAESPGPDVGEVPGDGSRSIDSPGPDVGEVPGEEYRSTESLEPDVGKVPGEGSGRAESPGPDVGVSDAIDQEAEILYSPGPDVEDSPGQEGGLKGSSRLDLGGIPGQEGWFMESPKAGVAYGSNHEAEQTGSLESDVRDTLGQEGGFRKSCEMDEKDAFGLMESRGLGEIPGQKGKFLESPEEGVDNGSSWVTEQTGSPGPDMRDDPGQEAGFKESYETNMEDALGKEVEFDLDGGDAVTGQGILVLETHEPNVGDASRPDQITGLIESHGPEIGDILSQEAKIMHSPDSERCEDFGQEAKFMELCERVEEDAEIADIMYSPVLDMSDSPDQEPGVVELYGLYVNETPIQEARVLESPETDVGDGPGHEVVISESYEADEEDAFGLMESPVPGLGETPDQEGKFLVSPEEGVDDGSSQVTEQTGSPGPDMRDDPGQEAGFREYYGTDMEDALGKEVEFGLDGGDVVTGQGTVMLETHEADVSDASRPDQITGLIESHGPEMGDIPSQEAKTMHLPDSERCEDFGQEAKFMEGDAEIAEVMYSSVPDMSECPDQEAGVVESHGVYVNEIPIQEARVLESLETHVGDGPGQEVVISESYEAGVGNASVQDAEIMHSPVLGVSDSASLESESMHSPGPYVGDSPGQEAELAELHRSDVGNASNEEARFMSSPVADVSDAAGQETEILCSPGPEVEDFPGQVAGLKKSLVLNLGGAPVQESRSLELPEAGVDDGSCQQIGQIRSPGADVKNAAGRETESLHSPSRDVGDCCHQGIYRLIDSSRPMVNILSDGEMQLPESRLGDPPEEKPDNIESPRPDVLPVIPERGGLQDQKPEDVWRAQDRGLQRQAQEGPLFPQDSEQALSSLVEAGVQSGPKVLGGQSTPLFSGREENRSGVPEEIKAEAAGASSGERPPDPDYLFHVLFLGDSNVGKTSFLHLLHHDSFATGLTATVGMDYRIKNLVVDNRRFALQLWDTAGQERYHSITKQFLRKADGIVLMYDITCPRSFTHVRYWLDCIQEAGPDDVVILLLGNKIDCVEERQVSTEDGQLLAKEIGVIFGECSAVLGHNILEPIVTLARALQQQEAKLKHSVVELEKKEAKKKAGCCS